MARRLTEQALALVRTVRLRTSPEITAPPPGEDCAAPIRVRADDPIATAQPRPADTAPDTGIVEILGIGQQFNTTPLGRATRSDLPWSAAILDWDNLLSVVKAGEAVDHVSKDLSGSVFARDVAVGDWDDLMNAVKVRLRETVAEATLETSEPALEHAAEAMRTSVLECVAALDQLHSTLVHELGRCRQLKLEVLSAQSALAQARSELLGTRAGERRARHLALHDGLTALPNARYFRERLDKALNEPEARRPSIALLYLDLDGFKEINDAHGHDAGDELLKIVAARLTRAVRGGDMVSRLGGDEFACLLEDSLERRHLTRLASKVFDAVCAPLKIGPLELTVRPSIGIAICPVDGETADALLKNADTAMYHAKRHRLGHAFCDQISVG